MEQMKRILQILLVYIATAVSNSYAQDMYNSIATAYVTTTISQNVVFNSAMQAGGTFELSVLAHNGGGRAGQSDTANVRIQFYTSDGTLVTSAQTNYSGNLPNPQNVCGNPCIDPSVPWSTLTISSTLTQAQASTVAYAKISFYGIDGSFWAGDYGPWYRAPTFTFNGGTNMAYNPEFGPYNNIAAQGWTISPALGACQGAWGGSNPCIANSSGTPGTSTTGLVANQNGGGPDTNGGTTSGTAGGYNSTMTTSSPTGAPATPTPSYQNISTSSTNVYITNIYPTSLNSPAGEGAENAFDGNPNTKYLNFDKYNAGVTVKLSSGRVIKGFTLTTANDFPGRDPTSYKLYGSNNGTTWTLLSEGALNLSNDRFTTSSEITVANTNAYVYYYIFFPTTKAGDGCGQDCNSMQIGEITFIYDVNNPTTSSDAGGGSVSNPGSFCCGGTNAPFNANTQFTNRVTAFSIRPLQDTVVIITQIGNNNSATVQQSGTRHNYSEIYVSGNNNTTNTTQTSTNISATNYIELDVIGSSNTVNLTQQSTGGTKGILATVNDSNNSLTVNQSGSGNHYAEISVGGGSKTVNLTQSGSAAHMANISLTGGATAITATQSGSTQQYYSITHNCAQVSCSAITVTQGQ
jgi:hypothetical protein